MKRVIKIILIILLIAGAGWAIYYNFVKSKQDVQEFQTTKAFFTDIKKTAVATGEIKPKQTIEIKPNIAGVIDKLYAKEGDVVPKGALIATVKVIPDVSSLNNAQQQIRAAEISVEFEQKNINRQEYLYKQGIIAKAEYDNALNSYKAAQQNLQAAQKNYKVVQSGIAPGLEKYATTQIRATISGTILTIPVEVGNTVQQINNFSTGTTIATMADVKQMIFEGKVDESEVGKLSEGMSITIKIGAIPNETFNGNLYFISPSGTAENGVIQFEIKASILLRQDAPIRAGYSANAEIVIDNAHKVMALKESVIQYDDAGNPFVEIKKGTNWEKRMLTLGITDGVNIQVLKGINQNDLVKVWNTDTKEKQQGGPRRK